MEISINVLKIIKNVISKKNAKLEEEGWQVLRLIWKDVYVEPKKFIKLAKEFIDK